MTLRKYINLFENVIGNDYIVRHGPGNYGVVKRDIFAKTYVQE